MKFLSIQVQEEKKLIKEFLSRIASYPICLLPIFSLTNKQNKENKKSKKLCRNNNFLKFLEIIGIQILIFTCRILAVRHYNYQE